MSIMNGTGALVAIMCMCAGGWCAAVDVPTLTAAGDWKVVAACGAAKGAFEVATPDVVHVKDERHGALPLFNAKQPAYCRGLHVMGVRTYGISVNGALDASSLAMKLEDGTPLVRDRDYHLQADWGCISRLPGGRIGEKTPVVVSYAYTLRRLDVVVKKADGTLALKPGQPTVCLPKRAPLAAGESYVGTVYLHAGQSRLTDEDLYPVLDPLPPPPAGRSADGRCVAAALCPKTYAKLVAGEPVTILAWGDSVTECTYLSNREDHWQNQFVNRLRAQFPKAKITLVEDGWGGRTVEAFFGRKKGEQHSYEGCVLDCVPKPDLVVSEFINDAYLDNDAKVGRVYGQVLKDFRARGFEWIICTPHYARPDWNGLKSMKNCDLDPRGFTQSLRRFAAQNGIAVADASARWGHLWREGVPYITHLTNDINHPDAESLGYFADALMALFR